MIFRDRVIVGVFASISVIATAVAVSAALQPPDRSGERPLCLEGFFLSPEESLGQQVSLEEAQRGFNFSFNVPSFLPRGTTLDRIYLHESGDFVSVYYNNSRIQSQCYPGGRTEIEIQFIISDRDPVERLLVDPLPHRILVEDEDGVRVVEVPREPRAGSVVSICSVEGWGIEPSDSPLRNGQLIWWIEGLEYHITSRIPLNQILRIANSMC